MHPFPHPYRVGAPPSRAPQFHSRQQKNAGLAYSYIYFGIRQPSPNILDHSASSIFQESWCTPIWGTTTTFPTTTTTKNILAHSYIDFMSQNNLPKSFYTSHPLQYSIIVSAPQSLKTQHFLPNKSLFANVSIVRQIVFFLLLFFCEQPLPDFLSHAPLFNTPLKVLAHP